MGRHDFLECKRMHYVFGRRLHSDLSSKGGVKIYISRRWEISCMCIASCWWSTALWMDATYCVVEILLNIIFGWSVFGMKSLRLDVSYCIVEIWAIIICEQQIYHAFPCSASIVMTNEHNRHCGCTRYEVESCDVSVGNLNRTLFDVFGNILTVWEPNESFWSSVDRF